MSKSENAKARRRLLVIAALFVVPVVAAYALYYSGWRPQAVHTSGELVTPAHPVADIALVGIDGSPRTLSALRPQWLLVYFGAGECDDSCERALYLMRQTIAAQGRQAFRVRSVMIAADQRALDGLKLHLKTGYPDIIGLTGTPDVVVRLAREFDIAAGNPLSVLNRIYVVDPLGNFMMSYRVDVDPSGIRKDLARLLRLSQVG